MKIKRLELRNFRLFTEKHIDFPESNMTVLIGDNGAGKTTILDAIAIFLHNFIVDNHSYHTFPHKQAKYSPSKKFAQLMTSAYEAFGAGISETDFPKFSEIDIYKRRNFSESIFTIEVENKPVITLKSSFDTHGSASQDVDLKYKQMLIEKLLENPSLSLPILLYHPTDRVSPKNIPQQEQEESTNLLPQLEAYKNAFQSDKINLKDWIIWYKNQDYEEAKLGRREKNYSKTIPTLDCARTVFETFFSVLGETPYRILEAKTKNRTTTLLISKGNEELFLEQLSSGERALLSMVVDIASRLSIANPLLGKEAYKGTGIVLIDEIELHLHPKWQRLVLPALKATFPNIQFIITTHSPFIVQSLEEGEIINLEETEGIEGDPFKHSIEDIAEFEMGVEMPQRSQKFLEMERVASEYFALVAQGKTSQTDKEVAQLRQRLNELENYYSDDPAFVAFLKAERKSQTL